MKVKETYIFDHMSTSFLYELENGKWFLRVYGNSFMDAVNEYIEEEKALELLQLWEEYEK